MQRNMKTGKKTSHPGRVRNARKGPLRGRTANAEAEPTTTEEPRENPGVINPELGAEISWWYREFHFEIDELSEDDEVFI